jgi:hypothetical protein
LTDSEIDDLTGVDCRRVNQLRKALTETRDPRQVVMVMVCRVVSSEGDVMPSHIFETGLRVNTDIYLEVSGRSSSLGVSAKLGPCHVSQQVHQVAQGPLL